MTMFTVIGVTGAELSERIVSNGLQLAGNKVGAVQAYGLGLLYAEQARRGFLGLSTRKDALRQVYEMQRTLEAIMPMGPVLPVVGGAQLNNQIEMLGLLATSHLELREKLGLFGDKFQFQLTVSWLPEAVLKANADHPDIIAARGTSHSRHALGQAIQSVMKTLRAELATGIRTKLEPYVLDLIDEPLDGPDMVFNAAVMLDAGSETAFETTLEAIDGSYPDQLKIRLVGPYPAASFAGVVLERFESGKISEASSLLGVSAKSGAAAVREAYTNYLKSHHPDIHYHTGDDGQDDLEPVHEAYRILKILSQLPPEASQYQTDGTILANVMRNGDVRRAA